MLLLESPAAGNMANGDKDRIIISVGGSLFVKKEGIDTKFLTALNDFVRTQLAGNTKRQFFLVSGGGYRTRQYQDAAKAVIHHDLTRDDLDWLGLHATRLNAHLLRTIFRDLAHPAIIKDYDYIVKTDKSVVIASGWKPGWSTDYCAVLLAEDYHVPTVINMSNITKVYDKDPNQFKDAKPIDSISWADFRKLVGDEWVPGMHAPFDPIAAKKAQGLGLRVAVMGSDFTNVERFLKGETFVGTVIE